MDAQPMTKSQIDNFSVESEYSDNYKVFVQMGFVYSENQG